MSAFLPRLPQDQRFSWTRSLQLKFSRHFYKYNYSHVNPLAMVDHVPLTEKFSYKWIKEVGQRVLSGLANHVDLERDRFDVSRRSARLHLSSRVLKSGPRSIRSLRKLVGEFLSLDEGLASKTHRPESLDDYGDLFRTIGLPPIHKDFQDDAVFAYMRVAGPNPVMLQQVKELDDRFPVTDAVYSATMTGDSLEAAGQEGRLYLVDYAALDGVEGGTFPRGQKYLCAPLALFAVPRDSGSLQPVAIQCQQKPGSENPIFTPQDGYGWLIAKTIVEIADANVHEAVTHLARTHLFMEPFVVATHRQLAKNHPLYLLLTPHFQGTLAINEAAWKKLIADKGAVDKLAAGTIQATRGLAVQGVQSALFNEQMLPASFQARGVADTDALPVYPYRDDSLLYWNAIREWTDDYVALYYKSEEDLSRDRELASWHADLVASNGGRINGIGQRGGITSRDYLVDVATLVIYTCSVQHAAVNFPQFDFMSYVPNMPLAGYAPPPAQQGGASEQDFLDLLPPLDMAELQLNLGYLLGTVHYTQLGHYEPRQFRDPQVSNPLKNFQDRISSIGETIEQRNGQRRDYSFLLPAGIPQSINI